MKKNFKKSALPLLLTLALSLVSAGNARAGIINTGTLDVSPADDGSSGWFTQYLAPGESSQERIRISNLDSKTKELEIYVSDAVDERDSTGASAATAPATANALAPGTPPAQPAFFAKSRTEKSDDIAGWIHLPTDELTLAPGETATLSVNFIAPKNAGVGLHKGAIIVREKADTDYGQIAIEKGVRVYLNITGPVIAKSAITSAAANQNATGVTLRITTANTGTVDRLSSYGLTLKEVFGNDTKSAQTGSRIKPSTAVTDEITIEKPSYGVYSVYASDGTNTEYAGTTIFIPLWALLLFLCAALAVTRPAFNISLKPFQNRAFKHAFAYFGIFTIMAGATLTLSLSTMGSESADAQSTGPLPAHSYIFTVKWGNFRDLSVPASYQKTWDGNISFENAKISIVDYLHFEKTDKAEVTAENTVLNFKNTTGPDNDGVVIQIDPTSDKNPTATLIDRTTGEKYTFTVTDFLDAAAVYPSGLFAIHLKTEPRHEHDVEVSGTGITGELSATPEIEATPSVSEVIPGANIPELENLFVEDLPATPEVLADFILKSSYIDEVTTERKTSKYKTDPILIKALSATPEVLAEITASPDLNFIFIPNAMVKFPPQEFSFDETKVTVENMGTMIFVQNKGTPWNTYVGTTDFTALWGDSVIPAYSLTILPGEPVILGEMNGAKIEPGNPRAFKGTADKSVLVNVDPGSSSRQVFMLNPQLQVRIPPGTLPGHYRGTLTITSL